MPSFEEPDDAAVHAAMQSYTKQQSAPINSLYDIARVDLDRDGKRDALVLMKTPHTYWCDWGGCPMLAFQARGKGFKFISRTENVRGPVFVSHDKSSDWRKIITRASGTHISDRNVVLTFNGLTYPQNTLGAPTYGAEPHSRIMDKFFR
ncbi:MAG: hypothetical protein CMH31_04665 [Micavibrio sp.]|nr:hypothetical protein [Micavibrio sp.]